MNNRQLTEHFSMACVYQLCNQRVVLLLCGI